MDIAISDFYYEDCGDRRSRSFVVSIKDATSSRKQSVKLLPRSGGANAGAPVVPVTTRSRGCPA